MRVMVGARLTSLGSACPWSGCSAGVLLAMLAACTRSSAPPEMRNTAVARAAFPGLGVSMEVPVGAHVDHLGDRVLIDLHPGVRRPETIQLSPVGADAVGTGSGITLNGGARLIHTTERFEGGSGGPEASLRGVLRVGKTTLRVGCHIQVDEIGLPPDPLWCVPLLSSMVELPGDAATMPAPAGR